MRDSTVYVPVHAGIWRHRKVRRFRRLLGLGEAQAVGHLVSLWTAALDQAADGVLDGWDAMDVADAARWDGDEDALVSALADAGIVEGEMGSFSIHDWDLYAGKGIKRRAAARERMRAHRAKRKSEGDSNVRARSRTDANVLGEWEGEGEKESIERDRAQAGATNHDGAPDEHQPNVDAGAPPASGAPSSLSEAATRWAVSVASARPGFFCTPEDIIAEHGAELARLEGKPGFAECVDDHIASGKIGKGIGPGPIRYLAAMVVNWTPKKPKPTRPGRQDHLCPLGPAMTPEEIAEMERLTAEVDPDDPFEGAL